MSEKKIEREREGEREGQRETKRERDTLTKRCSPYKQSPDAEQSKWIKPTAPFRHACDDANQSIIK